MIRLITTPIHIIPSVEPGTEPGVGTGVGVTGLRREIGPISGAFCREEPESGPRKLSSPTTVTIRSG